MRRKKIIEVLEREIIEHQEELHFEEHQGARAYINGLLDGVGLALSMLKPNSTVISLTSSWWTEPTQTIERDRERVIELQYVDLENPQLDTADAEPICYAGLFETAEAE